MVFRVNYDISTQRIVSYQEGGDPDVNDCPDGCATLVFEKVFPPMFDSNGQCVMRVSDNKIVFTQEPVIPAPIEE